MATENRLLRAAELALEALTCAGSVAEGESLERCAIEALRAALTAAAQPASQEQSTCRPVARFNWHKGGFEWLTPYKFEKHNMRPLYLESDHAAIARKAAQEQLYAERERHTAEVKRLQAEIRKLQASQEQAQPSGEVSDTDIEAAITKAVRERRLSWVGFKKDDQGTYNTPVLSPSDYQAARAILDYVYTAAPKPVPMTEGEAIAIMARLQTMEFTGPLHAFQTIARAVEAHHHITGEAK